MLKNANSRFYFVFAFLIEFILLATSMMIGYFLREYRYQKEVRFPILNEAFDILKDNALVNLPPESKMEYGMIRGMLQVYNEPYTVFVEPPEHELQSNQLEGKFGGIGARLEKDQQNHIVLYPFPDSPADKAGVRGGDFLVQVDELTISSDTTLEEAEAAIRGPVNEKVRLIVSRQPDHIQLPFEIIRQEVALPSVTYNLVLSDPQVGILQINMVADTTPDEIVKAIKSLQLQGAEYFILDLRNNNGGLVEAGVEVSRLFLKDGIVMFQQYRNKPVESFEVKIPGAFSTIPVVVLVNHGTASAAEIIAGSLQGSRRAKLVGATTYGKDTIQLVFELRDKSSIHVTAAHWWIPGLNQFVLGKGLIPDVQLPDEITNSAAILEYAVQELLPAKRLAE